LNRKEGDLILGSNCRSAIGTLVERQTRYCLLVRLPDGHGAETVRDALVASITTLPEHLRRSLTWDQGTELAQHRAITLATDMAIYFCDPHSPWQRGSNENTNGLLRQYFPKGTDLSAHSAEHLAAVAAELNGRPRKTLGFITPAEAMQRLLSDPEKPVVATTA
jgi:IS30 family transposase